MKHTADTSSSCRSVFHSGETTTKEHYTQAWIRLINQLEKIRVPLRVSNDQDTVPHTHRMEDCLPLKEQT